MTTMIPKLTTLALTLLAFSAFVAGTALASPMIASLAFIGAILSLALSFAAAIGVLSEVFR